MSTAILRVPLLSLNDADGECADLVHGVLASALDLPGVAGFRDLLAAPSNAVRQAVLTATTPVTVGPRRSLRYKAPGRLRVRVSGRALAAVRDALLETAGQDGWTVRRNPTARSVGDTVRFLPPGARVATQLRRSSAVEVVLVECGEARKLGDLADRLLELSPDADLGALRGFLAKLISVGLLVRTDNSLGRYDLRSCTESLREAGETAAAVALADVDRVLRSLSSVPDLGRWQSDGGWRKHAAAIPGLADVPASHQLDVELESGAEDYQVDQACVEAAGDASTLLGAVPGAALETFVNDYRARYGDAAVPLTELVEPDFGLLRPSRDWAGHDPARVPAQALAHWLRTGDPFDLADSGAAAGPARSGWYVLSLLDRDQAGFSSVLQRSGQILPGEVAAGFTTADGERRTAVPPEMLLVSVTAADEVVLFDARTGEVVSRPAEASADDPVGGGLARLLALSENAWSWGVLSSLPHLPRVVCGDTIVSLERWSLDRAVIAAGAQGSDSSIALRGLLEGIGTRRWIGLLEPSRILPFDSTDTEAVSAVLAALHDDATLELVELPQLECPAIAGRHGRHTAELLVERSSRPRARPVVFDDAAQSNEPRIEFPCSRGAAETVLAILRERFTETATKSGVDAWGYERSGDSLVVIAQPKAGDREAAVAAILSLGDELRREGLTGVPIVTGLPPLVTEFGGYRAAELMSEFGLCDSADVVIFLSSRPDLSTRVHRATADLLTWTGVAEWDVRNRIRVLSATYWAAVADTAAAQHAVRRFLPLAGVGPALSSKLTERRWLDVVEEAPGPASWPGVGLPALVTLLRGHCGRIFSTEPDHWTAVACELAIRVVRTDQAMASKLARGESA